ncbi:mandelate racemase/muconate lactonizing enzyme family protein [Defluviimonas salinarum]|uniref:Mandelate racemase/muconate lactonizing enzyme C-terminal domain-containing protein n=1 Tax=Defluviimonas salinarum TaxID=2992147 RepID=A0ABT3J381_9RHOB|nr:enolase C-terminal domain-like protein [Defluviimonas salinarum]MCW3782111.1 hypothetical protein [Defluviimonas salinarum]
MENEFQIDRVRVYGLRGSDSGLSWSARMPTIHTTNTVVRIDTSGGLSGASSVFSCTQFDNDRGIAEMCRLLLPGLIGRAGMHREEIWSWMQDRRLSVTPAAVAAIDIALWDLVANRAGLPLYQMLGGARRRIPAYASTQVFDDAQAYIDHIAELRQKGFRTFKLHCWCDPDRDIELARTIRSDSGSRDLRFMLDAESAYSHKDALKVARALQEMGFLWLEAPFPDHDLVGYAELRNKVDLPILPGGNTIIDLPHIAQGIHQRCWDGVRVDAAIAGGVTPVRKVMGLAEAYGMNVELQSWGCSLSRAANLHLMLAHMNCGFYEYPVPAEHFDYPFMDSIPIDKDGHVAAADRPGLGVDVDWSELERNAFYVIDCYSRGGITEIEVEDRARGTEAGGSSVSR